MPVGNTKEKRANQRKFCPWTPGSLRASPSDPPMTKKQKDELAAQTAEFIANSKVIVYDAAGKPIE